MANGKRETSEREIRRLFYRMCRKDRLGLFLKYDTLSSETLAVIPLKFWQDGLRQLLEESNWEAVLKDMGDAQCI